MANNQFNFQSLYSRLSDDLAALLGNMSETLTAAGSVLQAALSINSATASAQSFNATATQLTTSRTSGTVAAYKGSTVSLAGDSGGDYVAFYAPTPTDGGGTVEHFGLKVDGGDYGAWAADSVPHAVGTGNDCTWTHNGTNTVVTNATGNYEIDNTAAAGAIYCTLGTDTSATEFAVRNNSTTRAFIVDGAGAITLGNGTGAITQTDGSTLERPGTGTGTGEIIEHLGPASEGMNVVVFENTISPAAVETAVLTVPAGSIVEGVWVNVEAALTGGGTTATWSLGLSGGDLDAYGTATSDDYSTQADSLLQNVKWTYLGGATPLTNAGKEIGLFHETAQAIVLTGCAAGGTTAGDTALTVGSLRIRIQYKTALTMADA